MITMHTDKTVMEKLEKLFIVVLWGLLLLLCWHAITARTDAGLSLDDGYIHLVYAKNLLSGHIFQFNIGETSTGSTSPLWVILVATFGAIFGLMPAVWILSAISFLLAAFSSYYLARKILLALGKDNRTIPMFSALAVVLFGRFLWHAFSGMETQLFSAVVTFSIALFITEAVERRKNIASAILSGLAIFIRPETFLLYVIMFSGYIFVHRKNIRRAILPIMIIAGFSALYFAFNLLLTGHLLPNTFFSKSAIYRGTRWDYIAYTISTFWHDNFALIIALILSSIVLIVISAKKKMLIALLPLLWVFGLPAAKFLVSIQEVHFGRYTIVIVPSLTAVAFSSLAFFKKRWHILAVCIAILLPSIVGLPRWIKMPARTIEQINTIHGQTAKWILKNTSDDDLVATHDVGRIKYDTGRKILDLAGLTSNEATMLIWEKRKLLHEHYIVFDSIAAKLILKHHPKVLAISPIWFPYIAANRSAVKFLWRTHQYINAVECVPELDVYEVLPSADTTIFQFWRYGFHPDKQWIIRTMLPQAAQVVMTMSAMPSEERTHYIQYIREQNKKVYPYFDVSLHGILNDLIDWKMYDEGIIVATFGCALYPENAELWNIRGALYSQTKKFDRATNSFQKAVSLAPDREEYRANYAISLLNSGRTDEAKAQADSILAKNPENGIAQKVIEKIEEQK